MAEFSLDLTPITWVLMGIALFAALVIMIFYRRKIARVYRYFLTCETYATESQATSPGVSVIVYCNGEAQALKSLLTQLLEQKYDGEYEVTIVNDGSNEDVKDVYNLLSSNHKNCNLTFIPQDAHYLSHRKLAITLGVKSARHDYVLILDASSHLNGDRWLSGMARHFAQGKDVVIGQAHYDPEDDCGVGAQRRAFDMASEGVTYLSAALTGHPYRGHASNIGFARQLFFNTKGFSRSLNLHSGEDDMFISSIVTPDNCGVELSEATQVTVDTSKPRNHHRRWKRSHMFTGRKVMKRSRMMMGFYSSMIWVGTLSAVASIAITLPYNFIPAISMSVVGIAVWILICNTWRQAIYALTGRSMWIAIPWMVLTQPVYNLCYRIASIRNNRDNYTWTLPRS